MRRRVFSLRLIEFQLLEIRKWLRAIGFQDCHCSGLSDSYSNALFSRPVFFTADCGSLCGPSVCLEYARCMRGVCATSKDPSWRPREALIAVLHPKDVQERSQANYVFYHKYYAPSMRVNIKNKILCATAVRLLRLTKWLCGTRLVFFFCMRHCGPDNPAHW